MRSTPSSIRSTRTRPTPSPGSTRWTGTSKPASRSYPPASSRSGELQKVTTSILEHHSRQNDTVICLLENANEVLCGITRKLTRQLDLSERQLTSLNRVEGIVERVHGTAAGDYDRAAELEAKILECCPPEEPEPEPCPEACEVTRDRPYKPKGQDWQPELQPAPIG
jgi:hypothetical protein